MGWWVSVVGALVVLLTPRELFHRLWHPTGHGQVSHSAMAAGWRLSRRAGWRRIRLHVGSATMAVAMLGWCVLVVLGGAVSWALQVSPALTRRSTLTRRVEQLGQVSAARRPTDPTPAHAARLIDELADQRTERAPEER